MNRRYKNPIYDLIEDNFYTGKDASMAGKKTGKTFFYRCNKGHNHIVSFSLTELERFENAKNRKTD